MSRRGLLAMGTALVALVGTTPFGLAQEGTVSPETAGIPPVVWQLTDFVDTGSGPEPVPESVIQTLQFLPNGTVLVKAACNVGSGTYTLEGPSLTFGPIATTRMACPELDLETRFLEELSFVTSYVIDQEGASDQLVLALMADGGFLNLSPVLTGVVWEWESFEGGDGTRTQPDDPSRYWIEFLDDGSLQGQVDCNDAIGSYETDGSSLEQIVGTTMLVCKEGTLGPDFVGYLADANSFVIRDGKLAMALPADAGIVTFRPVSKDFVTGATPEAGG
jgi:heat shock protein HslJ